MISGSFWMAIIIFAIIVVIALFTYYRLKIRRKAGEDAFAKGLLASIEGDFDEAIKNLKQAAMVNTQNVMAYILLGDILRYTGQVAKAMQIHLSLLGRTDLGRNTKVRVYKSLALDSQKKGDLKKAAEYLLNALEIKPEKWSYDMLIDIYEKLGEWEKAAEILRKAGAKDKERMISFYYAELAGSYLENGDIEKAKEYTKLALSFWDKCPPALLIMGELHFQDGDYKSAIDYWTEFIKNNPGKALPVAERVETAFYEMGEFDKVREHYQKLIDKNPELEPIRIKLALIDEKRGDVDEAFKVVSSAPKQSENIAIFKAYFNAINKGCAEIANELLPIIKSRLNPTYQCQNCGFKTQKLLWRCPKCGAWESFLP